MSTLDTNVYKLPSFSKQGFQLQQEQKKERETEISATRAEDNYMQSKHLLQGDFARDASTAFGAFQEAGVRYKKTGSEADRLAMKEASSQLSFIIAAGKTQLTTAGNAYSEAAANEFEGYAVDKEQIEKSYSNFTNRKWESKMENGVLMIKEGGTFVPISKSTLYSSTPNAANTYMIPKAVKQGKFVTADSFVREYKDVAGSTREEKLGKLNANIDYRFNEGNDVAFIRDAIMHYEINEEGKFKRGYSAADIREAEERYQKDPDYALAVQQSYKKDVAVKFDMYVKSSTGYGESPAAIETKDGVQLGVYTLKKKVGSIVALGQDAEGNYYKVLDLGTGITQVQPASDLDVSLVENNAGQLPQIWEKQESANTETGSEEEADATNQITGETMESKEGESTPEESVPQDMIPKPEEVKTEDGSQGFGGLQLNLPSMKNNQTGVAPPADMEVMLPDTFYENLLDYEGGVSTSESDLAYDANPDAPMYNGKRAHTNKGVQYRIFKQWAEEQGIPKSQWGDRFLSLTPQETVSIVDGFTKRSGSDNFESPVLRAMFTQNAWGTGKVWAADFRKDGSARYRALLDWLQGETGLDFKNTRSISKEEAEAIEKVFNENPKEFVNTFIDKKKIYFTSLGDNYKEHGDGWNRRAEDLRDRMLAELK